MYLEGKKFRDFGQQPNNRHVLQEPTPGFVLGDFCLKAGIAAGYVVLCQALGILVIRYCPILHGFTVPSLQCMHLARNLEQIQLSQDVTVPLTPEDTHIVSDTNLHLKL